MSFFDFGGESRLWNPDIHSKKLWRLLRQANNHRENRIETLG